MLLDRLVTLARDGWRSVFRRPESLNRALEHLTATPACLGRRTISRSLCVLDRASTDWSADYKLFSRSPWDPEKLFDPVIDGYLRCVSEGPIVVALDDTKIPKTGRRIPHAGWARDPLSPPFRVNLLWSQRFLHAAVVIPAEPARSIPPKALPIRFTEVPWIKKPGKRATDQEREVYRELKKEKNLSIDAVSMIRELRDQFDQRGAAQRPLLIAADGSFCNKTVFRASFDRTILLARTRKDARLCFPAPQPGRRIYAEQRFTPEQIRQDDSRPYQTTDVFWAGKTWSVLYKEVTDVLWQRGAASRRLRLIVIAPTPYMTPKRREYRDPAYLLTDDLDTHAPALIQAYFDRWQIEVCHREEKTDFGVGQAQVWSKLAAPRHPPFVVACYALMNLAALDEFGRTRTDHYTPLPKWRRPSARPSALDLLSLLRRELTLDLRPDNETLGKPASHPISAQNLIAYAST